MALVRLGGGVHDIRGSIGGTVFSKNASGNYIRSRITPVNPNTARQNAIRVAVQSLAPQWSGVLSPAERAGWAVYAANIVRTNKLGGVINLSGYNHFIRGNSIRVQNGDPVVTAFPTDLTLPPGDPLFAVEVDATNQQLSVTFDPALAWSITDDGFMYIYMSLPKAAGVNFIGGPFRLAGAIDGDTASPPTSPQIIPAPFTVAEGQQIACRARISEPDSRLSDYFLSRSAVVA